MPAELLRVPTQDELRERAYELWSWSCNRNSARVRRVMEQDYAEMPDLALPTHDTIRSWVSRQGWHERANQELATGYPQQVRAFRVGLWRLMQLSQERMFDALTGVQPLTKEEVATIKLLWSAWGLGSLGANQGGEMQVSIEADAEDLAALSVDERARRLRSLFVEQNTGHG